MRPPGRRGPHGALLPVAAGIVVGLLAALVLGLTHHQAASVVPNRVAIRAALHDPLTEHQLAGAHWDQITVNSLDDHLEHVSFFAGGRLLVSVSVDRALHVFPSDNARAETVPYGDWIAYQPDFLAAFCALFALAAGVAPWRRLRNLDVAACISFVAPVVLLEHYYMNASLLSSLPGLLYLLARCLGKAFGPAREPEPQQPLLAALTPALDPARRVRWLRGLLAALALVFLMVGVSSPVPVDVLYATMMGATSLIHGILPYGHLPQGVVHGDTYPILTYAMYTPLALFAPVHSIWGDSVDAGLAATVAAALVAAWFLFRGIAGGRGSARSRRRPEAEEAGLLAAVALLTFPSLLITVSTGTTDVVLATMLACAVLLWRRPAAFAGALAAAGWFKLAPFALLPVSLAPLRGRRLARAVAAIVGVSAPLIALLLLLGGLRGPIDMVHAMSFQLSRGSLQSVWSVFGAERLQPVAQGCVIGLVAGAAIALRRDPAMARDRVRMASLLAAILLALQLSADYWAFLYLTWVVPLIGLSLLSDQRAPALQPAPSLTGRLRPATAAAAG